MEYSRWEALCETEVVGALSRPRAPLRAQTPPDVREQGDGETNTEKRYVCVLMLIGKMKGDGGRQTL